MCVRKFWRQGQHFNKTTQNRARPVLLFLSLSSLRCVCVGWQMRWRLMMSQLFFGRWPVWMKCIVRYWQTVFMNRVLLLRIIWFSRLELCIYKRTKMMAYKQKRLITTANFVTTRTVIINKQKTEGQCCLRCGDLFTSDCGGRPESGITQNKNRMSKNNRSNRTRWHIRGSLDRKFLVTHFMLT